MFLRHHFQIKQTKGYKIVSPVFTLMVTSNFSLAKILFVGQKYAKSKMVSNQVAVYKRADRCQLLNYNK